LKLCPGCGTISSEESENCGVCGADLRDIVDQATDVVIQEKENLEIGDAARLHKEIRTEEKKAYVTLLKGYLEFGVIQVILVIAFTLLLAITLAWGFKYFR
jgi:uncharacterized membrane protein YvbJ